MTEGVLAPEPLLGILQCENSHKKEDYFISKAELAIEKVFDKTLLFLSIETAHYTVSGENKIMIGEILFSILMPIQQDLKGATNHSFPNVDIHDERWEKTLYSNFYEFEHFRVFDCDIKIEENEGEYKISLRGDKVGESQNSIFDIKFNATFNAKLSPKINRNTCYFLNGN